MAGPSAPRESARNDRWCTADCSKELLQRGGTSLCRSRPGTAIELYERDSARDSLERIDPRRAGNLNTWLIPCRESEALLTRARAQVEPIVASDPQSIAVHPCTPS